MLSYFLMPHPPIIIPEVGRGREEEVRKTINACSEVGNRIEKMNPDTIIVITPHGTVFRDAVAMITEKEIEGDFGGFGAPQVKMKYEINRELSMRIIKHAGEEGIAVAHLDKNSSRLYGVKLEFDHGAMVPLYFADKNRRCRLVHITYGMLSPIELMNFGRCIEKAVEESGVKAVFIASGDLSHRLTEDGPYPYTPLGIKFDVELIDRLKSGKLEEIFNIDKKLVKEAGECGLRSLYILAGAINSSEVKSDLLNYEGPLGVGYGVMEFKGNDNDLYGEILTEKKKEHERRMREGNPYTMLARRNLDSYFNKGKVLTLEDVNDDKLLKDRKGVFVSLKINNELRGCIGTIAPITGSVAEEIIRNSISAALNDPRFSPVKKDELLDIDISVDLLYPPERTDYEGLDPKVYGVIVSYGEKRGLLLPNLEGIDTKEEQVSIAREKGGIREDSPYSLERFKVERFKEVEDDE